MRIGSLLRRRLLLVQHQHPQVEVLANLLLPNID
jgi:hypothetical protein